MEGVRVEKIMGAGVLKMFVSAAIVPIGAMGAVVVGTVAEVDGTSVIGS